MLKKIKNMFTKKPKKLKPNAALLISATMRYNHSFGSYVGSIDEIRWNDLSHKQISLIHETYRALWFIHNSETYGFTGWQTQLLEETTGQGFYKPDGSNSAYYLSLVHPDALKEAVRLAKEGW